LWCSKTDLYSAIKYEDSEALDITLAIARYLLPSDPLLKYHGGQEIIDAWLVRLNNNLEDEATSDRLTRRETSFRINVFHE